MLCRRNGQNEHEGQSLNSHSIRAAMRRCSQSRGLCAYADGVWIVRAANPKYGRYDKYEGIATQFNLGMPCFQG